MLIQLFEILRFLVYDRNIQPRSDQRHHAQAYGDRFAVPRFRRKLPTRGDELQIHQEYKL